jgi:hypothetical protein
MGRIDPEGEGATMGEKVLEVVLTMHEYGVDWRLGSGQRGDLAITFIMGQQFSCDVIPFPYNEQWFSVLWRQGCRGREPKMEEYGRMMLVVARFGVRREASYRVSYLHVPRQSHASTGRRA